MPSSDFDTPMNGRSTPNLPPAGPTRAAPWKLIDVGTNLNTMYVPKRQIVIGWLLFDNAGQPLQKTDQYYHEVLSFYSWTLGKSGNNPSRLRTTVETLIQDKLPFNRQKFNLSSILGLSAFLDIEYGETRDGNPFAKYSSIMKFPASEVPLQLPDPPLTFLISETRCDIPTWIPKFLANMIRMSAEWQGLDIQETNYKSKEPIGFRPARETTIDGRDTPPVRTKPLASDIDEAEEIPF